ncbi:MAG: HPF/RaiA family ribosome-associated protein [Anaerolineae bacterium]|nr:HPF/RaiA family ribosome-associated protein [Anaerolineae bacterium]
MTELDFTIEFNSDVTGEATEMELFTEADERLRDLAGDHNDLTGAAITLRAPAHGKTPPVYEATVVVYARPENIAATEKTPDLNAAMKGALDAVERQVREKRDKFREHWKRPANEPVIQENIEVAAGEEITPDLDTTPADE